MIQPFDKVESHRISLYLKDIEKCGEMIGKLSEWADGDMLYDHIVLEDELRYIASKCRRVLEMIPYTPERLRAQKEMGHE